jgi:hypothetical protein
MEQVELALPEDTCKVTEELAVNLLDLLLSFLLVASLHELINIVASLVCVGPLLKTESDLQLLFTEGQDLSHLLVFIQLDGIWNST